MRVHKFLYICSQSFIEMKTIFTGLLCVVGFIFTVNGYGQSIGNRISQDSLINSLLDLKTEMTKDSKLGDRYRIQIGSSESLKTAEKIEKKFKKEFEEKWPVELKYESPNYKVWVGNFTTRLETERVYSKLKDDYKSAFVFKP